MEHDHADFLGRRVAFPVHLGPDGAVALAAGPDAVEQSIRLILGTAPGERPMRPEFGCALHELVFDSLDVGLPSRVERVVRRALARWEPRIDVVDVAVAVDPDGPGVLHVVLDYRIKETNDPRNLVFPFYVIAEETT